MKKVIVLIFAVFLVFGCAKKEEKKGPYLAKINNVMITKEDLRKEIETLPSFAQRIFEGEEGLQKLIDELVKKELLYQEAKKRGLDKDSSYQKKIVDSQKLILISTLLEKEIEDKAKVSDKEVREFYEKNKADFTVKGAPIEFEKIKDMIAQRLTAQKQRQVFDTYIEGLRKASVIELNKEEIATLIKKDEVKKDEAVKEGTKKEEKKETPKTK